MPDFAATQVLRLQDEVVSLRAELEVERTCTTRQQALEDQVQGLQQQLSENALVLDGVAGDKEVVKLRRSTQRMRRQLEAHEVGRHEAESALKTAKSEMEAVVAERDKLRGELTRLQRLYRLKKNTTTSKDEVKRPARREDQARIAELEAEREADQERIKRLENERVAQRRALQDLVTDVEEQRRRNDARVVELRKEVDTYRRLLGDKPLAHRSRRSSFSSGVPSAWKR